MPWVNVITSKPLTETAQESIKAGLAPIILEGLEKGEDRLVVTFLSAVSVYRAGAKSANEAFVEVRFIGQKALDTKQMITRRISDLMAGAIPGVDRTKAWVLFFEFNSDSWGRNAGDY